MAPGRKPDGVPTAGGMPMLGFGTYRLTDPETCATAVETALSVGYRHVDTAQAYRNEDAVGDGIDAAGVPREELFLATKVWHSQLSDEGVVEAAEDSCERLGTDYLDLLYVHWPAGDYDPEETLPAFDELRDRGTIRHVGLSNFEPSHLDRAREVLDSPVFANQVEVHPLLPQHELREYAAEAGIEVVAYCPLVRGEVFEVPELQAVAAKHGVSEAQVSLAWLRAKGVTAIPKATSEAHVRDNWESLALSLDDEDVARIDGIDRRRRVVHPDFAPAAWN